MERFWPKEAGLNHFDPIEASQVVSKVHKTDLDSSLWDIAHEAFKHDSVESLLKIVVGSAIPFL
ncbi:MAG: hypothetical protein NBV63_01805 [Candidatus Pacebacteria bacterium]|nr:hypothetical protein [Candidatus Paceibacterota bacterium]